ncbi:MAG: chromosome partitioning protein [Frondihabitans sp.]|nr:chromosome partitioning protein [Frondihabitans sp.]
MSNTTIKQGTIEHIDPTTLVIEANVRLSAPVTPDFVASIRDNGVLTPVLARRDTEGNVIVRAGQRRTLAAREAGLATIPAYIIDADEITTERIIQQMIENDQREALTDGDRAVAFQQLSFEGLSVTAIAKRTGNKPAAVKSGIAVAENAVAASAIHSHQLTLDQAAALIEFEGDTDTVDSLIGTAIESPEQFAHAAQRARDERRINAIRDAATAGLVERGFIILDREPGYYETNYTPIRDLLTKDAQQVTEADIESVDGRAAFVRVYYTAEEATVLYYLADPKAAGFKKNSGNANGPMTDEQKTERKELIANNKAWASAETVRREWLTSLLSRKTLPKDSGKVIAQGLTVHRREVGTAITNGNALAHTLLGVTREEYWESDKLAAQVEQSPTRTQHVTLAIVLAGIEASTSKNTWRYPDAAKASYFTQLAAWGYSLSDVEQLVASSTPVTEADEEEAGPIDEDPEEVVDGE